ncbi:MAG: PIG-L family deacetylase [Planctomycetota bacterium]
MQDAEKLDVIAVGAHPDDCEIGCGGTLAALAEQGLAVGIIDLTDGEPTPRCEHPAIRRGEAMQAAKTLGIETREILELPNRRLFDSFEARVELAKRFRVHRPEIVIGLAGKTPMASPDHWQASLITDAAIFYSRLSKWDEHFDGLPVHPIKRQLYYDLFFEGEWSGMGSRQFVFDISQTLEKKLAAVRCYQSQFPPAKDYIFSRVRSMAHSVGQSAGIDAGEVLTSTKAIATNELTRFLQLD